MECFRYAATPMFDFGSCTSSRPVSCQWRRYIHFQEHVTPSDIQIRSVCLVLTHDTWLFRASRHSGVGAARQDNCNITSFEMKCLSSSVTFCKSTEKLNVLICQFLSMAAQFSLYNAYTLRRVELWAGGSMWSRLTIRCSIRDKETLRHARSYDTRSLIKVFSVWCNDEPC